MNVITIELCAEDRERIDRLTAALERKSCDACVNGALSWAEQIARGSGTAAEKAIEPDPLQQKLAETLARAADPEPVPAPAEAHPVDEPLPWGDPAPTPAPPAEVSLAEFQKALSLRCAESEAMKAKVRELLHEYAKAASQVPPEKRAEVLDRLGKL